jgi:hypothetical protein
MQGSPTQVFISNDTSTGSDAGDDRREVSQIEHEQSKRDESSWHFWYPSWDAWKFRRTLTYWISVMYLEGSILFLIGAMYSLSELAHTFHKVELALVQTAYLIGGVCFTLGSYAGLLDVINVKADGNDVLLWPCGPKWRQQRAVGNVNWKAFTGYISYLSGALLYNVNTIAGYLKLGPIEETAFVGVTALAGALAFLLGSLLECQVNKVWEMKVLRGAWWISMANLVGSVGYTIAGFSMLVKVEGTSNVDWLVNVPYLVGSAGFMVGAWFTMWLWKCEQYGLGFMPEMNEVQNREEAPDFILSVHAEYGCGRASPWQLPFLTMYLFNATGSVLLCGMALFWSHQDFAYELFEAVLNFALSHGVMLLGSVVHHVPTARPHSWLLVYMRGVLLFYTLNTWLNVVRHIQGFHDSTM